MSARPNLIIQQQRMGDLVLSFPLFAWLAQAEPERPVWVVAEKAFFDALVPLSPSVTYFEPNAAPSLRTVKFQRVINLSHRPEAALLAGSLKAESLYGRATLNGTPHIYGSWQMYRASLVHNNRHNLFHWADLNALDLIPPRVFQRSGWPVPRKPGGSGRIGLFVGASESAKRPEPEFWGQLALELSRRSFKPVFLGGKSEWSLGAKAAEIAGMPLNNLCGQFSLSELVAFLQNLDLLVTPDTGPMHVGAWGSTLTLNLSMGPVNAWETAPFPPGHLVLRPSASCTGCWQCPSAKPPCRERFVPARIASLLRVLLKNEGSRLPMPPGLQLLRTLRSAQGLFQLEPQLEPWNADSGTGLMAQGLPSAWEASKAAPRYALGDFWRQWFLHSLGGPEADLPTALERLQRLHPLGASLLRRSLPKFQAALTLSIRRKEITENFWLQAPPVLRPLSGYLQLDLENADFSRQSCLNAVSRLEELAALPF